MLRVDVERIRRAAIEIFLAPMCEFIFLRIYSRDLFPLWSRIPRYILGNLENFGSSYAKERDFSSKNL